MRRVVTLDGEDRMDLQSLRYFVAIAEQGSFTEGARQVNIVQSAASAAVARLERELGTDLFARSGRGIEITEAGHLLLAHARKMIATAQDARDDIDGLRGGLRGVVTLGSILTTGTLDIADALVCFREHHPHVRVHVRLSAQAVYEHFSALLDGTFDLLCASLPPHLPSDVHMTMIGHAQIVAVCAPGHPLAAAPPQTPEELASYTQIDFPLGWGNRQIVDQSFQQQGIERTVAIEVADVATALCLAAGEVGIAFVPRQFADAHTGVVTVKLPRLLPHVELGIAWTVRRPLTPPARGLRDAILASARA